MVPANAPANKKDYHLTKESINQSIMEDEHLLDGGPLSSSPRHASIMDPPSSDHSASLRRAARELLGINSMRGRRAIVDVRPALSELYLPGLAEEDEAEEGHDETLMGESVTHFSSSYYGALEDNGNELQPLIPPEKIQIMEEQPQPTRPATPTVGSYLTTFLQQTSAVAVVCLLNMMIAIPFGASYFPVQWRAAAAAADGDKAYGGDGGDQDDIHGTFPLPGKVALGIRMFLLATIVGQVVFTFASKFSNPVSLQMVENVPFLHALCYTVIREQGYGVEALSTLFFLFGLSSIVVGMTFYTLGAMGLGRVVYFFPNHVLVGCIGGIGVFMVVTAIEVTNDVTFSFDMDGVRGFLDNFHLFRVVLGLEVTLRILMWATEGKNGRPKFQLLSPIFYCMITPLFYLGLALLGVSTESAADAGYFFPPAEEGSGEGSSQWGIFTDEHIWDIFRVVDLRTVSWTAVFHSTGTMVALAAFSLIHVPINIPAFAVSTDVDTDMNAELMAHGYSNAISGLFGGLQNYMCYSNSVLYAKSGGVGKVSSLAISLFTIVLFIIGPSIANYLPRCMAGTLLLHIGVDLVLEGVFDSFGSYDHLEYAGIWLITLVMTVWGMTAALIAGVIAALSTYAVQSISFNNPIRQIMVATSLRSSAWNRGAASRAILDDDETGRSKILIFQLQGHLFFGNVAQLTDTIKKALREKREQGESPIVVIIDFTLVVGMDSSAAHAVAKLKKIIHRFFHIEVSIFVTGSDRGGFPCEFALSQALSPVEEAGVDWNDLSDPNKSQNASKGSSSVARGSISLIPGSAAVLVSKAIQPTGKVCESLDEGLIFAEDMLVARTDPTIKDSEYTGESDDMHSTNVTLNEEKFLAKKFLTQLCAGDGVDNLEARVNILLQSFKREIVMKDDVIWNQGNSSDCAKFVVLGKLKSSMEGTGPSEVIRRGDIVGELGLVHGTKRLTTLVCESENAVLYSLDREGWQKLKREHPEVSGMVDYIVILYLAHRVQHVSNRYFGRTLPV